MPGGIELTQEAEPYLALGPTTALLSVACGTGELELYLAAKYACPITGIDLDERFVQAAREKATSRELDHLVSFEIGDGNELDFENDTFDVVWCSGALCAFYHNGLREFHRVLKPRGTCTITDVVWRHEGVPSEVAARWTDSTAHIMTLDGNCAAFERQGFRILFAQGYHQPAWWEAYYHDRGNAPPWIEEHDNYRHDQEHLGLGLWVAQKE